MWMHNGMVSDFRLIKKKLINFLDDEILHLVQGTTDSEYCFMVFLQILLGLKQIAPKTTNDLIPESKVTIDDFSYLLMKEAMEKTINQLNTWLQEAGNTKGSLMNFCVSDGKTVVASRYANHKLPAASLFFSSGSQFKKGENSDNYIMSQSDRRQVCHIISSEPLTDDPDDWVEVYYCYLLVFCWI